MSTLVLDASVAIAWVLPSQSTPATQKLLAQSDDYELAAPYIFVWEVGNQFVRFSRRGLIYRDAMDNLDALGIRYFAPASIDDTLESGHGALAAGLSLFDYAYLSLAVTLGAPLASRDAGLLAACEALGAPFIDLR
ncbi:type II toxin-antitoxin system VapC family toxin [Glycocaulis sp.]|uniref:type II toxin-antitoxin system VapC family toxin n=1 Tax=Glycocaulis sp. TaxID=1969725 RepID=UPI003D1BDB41